MLPGENQPGGGPAPHNRHTLRPSALWRESAHVARKQDEPVGDSNSRLRISKALPQNGYGIVSHMRDDLDEVALNVLLAQGLDVPTSLAGSTCETRGTQQLNPSASRLRMAIVFSAMFIVVAIYFVLR
jgi:hypothetical protein